MKTFSFDRQVFYLIAYIMVSFSLVGYLAHAQAPPAGPLPAADPETVKVEIVLGVHAVITARSDRVTLQHDKSNTIIFIDTRPGTQRK